MVGFEAEEREGVSRELGQRLSFTLRVSGRGGVLERARLSRRNEQRGSTRRT